jgi:hypothetical protein
MTKLRIRPSLLALALNWLAFAAVFAWISATQHQLLWWLRLDWSSWLTQLDALAKLGRIPAGSLWILWLLVSAVWTLTAAGIASRPRGSADPEPRQDDARDLVHDPHHADAVPAPDIPTEAPQWQLTPDDPVLVAHAGLREKIQRLHQSLDRI